MVEITGFYINAPKKIFNRDQNLTIDRLTHTNIFACIEERRRKFS